MKQPDEIKQEFTRQMLQKPSTLQAAYGKQFYEACRSMFFDKEDAHGTLA